MTLLISGFLRFQATLVVRTPKCCWKVTCELAPDGVLTWTCHLSRLAGLDLIDDLIRCVLFPGSGEDHCMLFNADQDISDLEHPLPRCHSRCPASFTTWKSSPGHLDSVPCLPVMCHVREGHYSLLVCTEQVQCFETHPKRTHPGLHELVTGRKSFRFAGRIPKENTTLIFTLN